MRHQLAQRRKPLGRGRADDRADVRDAGAADGAGSELCDDLGEPIADVVAIGQLELLDVRGARVRGPDEHEHPAAARPSSVDERLQRVGPEQRIAVSASAPSPATGPNGVAVSPK